MLEGRHLVGWDERGEGIKYKLVVRNSDRNVNYNLENIVNIIVITVYGDMCVLEILGGSSC